MKPKLSAYNGIYNTGVYLFANQFNDYIYDIINI